MPYKDRGKWRAVATVRGKRYSQAFDTKSEAKEWEIEERKRQKSKTPTGTDFSTHYNEYLDFCQLRYTKNTQVEKVAVAKRLLKFMGENPPIKDITPDVVQSFLLESGRQSTNNRANRDRKNLLAFFAWLGKVRGVLPNPVSLLDRLPHKRKNQYIPPESDILQLLVGCPRRDRIFLNCYLQTAARRSSVFRWQWGEDIDFQLRQVRVGHSKTRDGSMEYIWLPMSDELFEDLQWWYRNREHRESPYVWTVPEGPYEGQPFTFRHKFLKGLCRRAGVRPFGFHAIRRYAATRLAAAGVAMTTIQRILGHKALSTTERYLGRSNEDLRETMRILGHGEQKVKENKNTTDHTTDEKNGSRKLSASH